MTEDYIIKMTRPRGDAPALWTVDAVVDHHVESTNGEPTLYYKIKWSPRDAYPDSWEPADNCLTCESAVVIY